MKKIIVGSMVAVLATVNFSVAAVNMDVNTPNASVHVGTPPPPQVILVGQERRHDDRHDYKKDNGKHKGQMKHKKHKKDRDEGKHKHHD